MGSSALVCEEEGAFSRVPPPPPSSFSGLAGRGDSPLFLLQLGLGQSREKLPSPLYSRVCQTVHGIGACRPGGGWEWLLDRPRVRSRGDQEICRSCHSGSPACHLSSPRNPWPSSQSLVLLGGEIRRAKLQFAKLPLPLPLATTPSFPVTGGSISNMYAVNLARYQRYPDCKQRGLRALPPLALFTSKEVGRGTGLPWAPNSNVQPAGSGTRDSACPDPSLRLACPIGGCASFHQRGCVRALVTLPAVWGSGGASSTVCTVHTLSPESVVHGPVASLSLLVSCCLVTKLCPTLCNPVDCSPPGSSGRGIF